MAMPKKSQSPDFCKKGKKSPRVSMSPSKVTSLKQLKGRGSKPRKQKK